MKKSKEEKAGKALEYSAKKWIKERMEEKDCAARALRNETMQLYEKGLLSPKTVLDVFGFDDTQEIDRKKDCADGNLSLKTRDYNDTDIKQMRIEQARRNMEALGKILTCPTNCIDTDKISKAIIRNMNIMDEVSKI